MARRINIRKNHEELGGARNREVEKPESERTRKNQEGLERSRRSQEGRQDEKEP